MADFDPIAYFKEVGGVVKFGNGVLGKSAVALAILLAAIVIAVFRLHSDSAIVGALLLGGLVFGGWFVCVLKFASDHPDVALLEGAEWTTYQRFQAAAKGFVPGPSDRIPTPLPGSAPDALPPAEGQES